MTTTAQRNKARKLQDKICEIADKRHYDEYSPVSRDMPREITLNMLRLYIYPEYLNELETVYKTLSTPR